MRVTGRPQFGRRHYDSAYGCFFLVGAVLLAVALVGILRITLSEGTLALVVLGLVLLTFGALPTLLGSSIRERQQGTGTDVRILWQHGPLRLLSLLSLLLVGTVLVGLLQDEGSRSFARIDAIFNTVSVVYGLLTSTLTIRWFVSARRRALD